MYSRKITFNRRRQRIGNLITGVLKHFGKSSAENITENVLKCSNQQMDYVSFAVQRALRCGTKWGYLVKTGDNTFCLPHQNYEIDGDKDPFVDMYYPADYTFCIEQKTVENGRPCRALDLMTHKQCTNHIPRCYKGDFCRVHNQLLTLFNYRIDFIERCTEDELRGYLKENCAALFETKMQIIEEHKSKLITFFKRYNRHIFQIRNTFFDEFFGMPPKLTKPNKGPGGCSGKNLEDCKPCQNIVIEYWFGDEKLKRLCEEHSVIALLLKGFSRTPKLKSVIDEKDYMKAVPPYLKKERFKAWKGPLTSFLDGYVAGAVYKPKEEIKRYYYNGVSKCNFHYFAVISRFQYLKITGEPYSKTRDYDAAVVSAIQQANLLSYEAPETKCQCLKADDAFYMFNETLDKHKYVRVTPETKEETEKRWNKRKDALEQAKSRIMAESGSGMAGSRGGEKRENEPEVDEEGFTKVPYKKRKK